MAGRHPIPPGEHAAHWGDDEPWHLAALLEYDAPQVWLPTAHRAATHSEQDYRTDPALRQLLKRFKRWEARLDPAHCRCELIGPLAGGCF